jgi:hypothetical protein
MIRVIESIQSFLGHIAENVAGAVEAVTAQATAQEAVVVKLDRLEEVMVSLTGKVGQLCDSVEDLNTRLGSYLTEQARKDVSLRQLASEVREIKRAASGER